MKECPRITIARREKRKTRSDIFLVAKKRRIFLFSPEAVPRNTAISDNIQAVQSEKCPKVSISALYLPGGISY